MLIRYFSDIRELTGEDERRWNRPAATLGELLSDLSEVYGPCFAQSVFDGNGGMQLSESVIVLINGHDVRHRGAGNAPLCQDDTVAIFPVFAGGNS